MTTTAGKSAEAVDRFKDLFRFDSDLKFPTTLMTWFVGVMICGIIGAIGYFVYERWKLRRRARA